MRRATSRTTLLRKKKVGAVAKPAYTRKGATRVSGSVYQALRENPRCKVLIIRALGGIGDVLMVTPLLRQLKLEFPNCVLTFAIDRHSTRSEDIYWELVKNCPFIDHVIDARHADKRKYDCWADVTSVCVRYEHKKLPVLNRIDIFARAVGIPRLQDSLPWYRVEPSERTWAREQLDPRRTKVILHTASFDGKRTWPAEHNQKLLELLVARRDLQVVLFDYNQTVKAPAGVLDCSKYSVRQKAAVIEQAALLIGPDSGPMHLAGALKTKSLVLFGPIPPEARLNHYPTHKPVLIEQRLGCQYCWYSRCDIGTKCLRDISPEQVFAQVQAAL